MSHSLRPVRPSPLARCAGPAAVLALLLAGAMPPALAQTPAPTQMPTAAAPANPAAGALLDIRQVYDRVAAAGYRDIREIELSHGRYEVKASNAQGERVKLDVNARTGAVERSRTRR